MVNTTDLTPIAANTDCALLAEQAMELIAAARHSQTALAAIRNRYPAASCLTDVELAGQIRKRFERPGSSTPDDDLLSLATAQLLTALDYGFSSWDALTTHVLALRDDRSSIYRFEEAADAVVNGNLDALENMLHDDPSLVHARSTRVHRATLLHYTAANGVENYRQRTPLNIVSIADILINAGAEPDACADMYGGDSTTLGLAVSSIHPEKAGVQAALIETLVKKGAAIDGLPGGWEPVMSALVNGSTQAAHTLVRLGASVSNVIAAAGLGMPGLVKSFFNSDDNSTGPHPAIKGVPANPEREKEEAFFMACRYGHTEIAGFLLGKGVAINAGAVTGQTGLHLAVHGGHLETVKMLLQHNAGLELQNQFGGTVTSQAVWSALHIPRPDHHTILTLLMASGADPAAVRCDTCSVLGNKACCYHSHCDPGESIPDSRIMAIDAIVKLA